MSPTPIDFCGSATILIVDCYDDHRELLRDCLEVHGYAIETARHGVAALSLVESAAIVLTSLRMPVMDGLTLLRTIRAIPGAPPVIVLSSDKYRRHEATAAGAAMFIVKPVDITCLLANIATIINRTSSTTGP